MSYTPHTWVEDETITHQKLNAMEQGIAEGGSGYDAEIAITDISGNNQVILTATSGTYSDIVSMLQNNVAPNILVRIYSETSRMGYEVTATNAVVIYSSDLVSSEPYITFACKCPTNNSGGTYTAEWYRFLFTWYSDDTITL